MISLCTLFDSNYLDKGLVLIDSLNDTGADYKIYIVAMDEKCREVLTTIEYPKVEVLSINKLLDYESRLSELRDKRGRAEFCWTCTSVLCEYILHELKAEEVTYIDADMYFYSSPEQILNETEKPVGIMRHRFPQNRYYKLLEKNSGTFCVEFNTFRNNEDALKVLFEWKEECLKSCNAIADDEVFGDQKYLEKWPLKYGKVIHIYDNNGAGIAPWNIKDYSINKNILLYKGNEVIPIFFHFAGIEYIDNNTVNSHAGNYDRKTLEWFYKPYLTKIEEKRDILEKQYNVNLRHSNSKSGIASKNEFKRAFISEIKLLIKRGKLIVALKKTVERIYVSIYSRNHYGTDADILKI